MQNSMQNVDEIKPVMLIEVMEMFLNHLKHETDSQKIQQTEMFKTFADRIVAHQQQQGSIVQNAQITNAQITNNSNNSNNKKFNLNLFLNEECKNAMNPDEPEGFCRGNDQPRPSRSGLR